MSKVTVYNFAGSKTSEMDLSDAVFNVPLNESLLHQVFVSMAANQRTVIAHTKDRAERAGSGKKPYRQKGTGNARAGQVRSPIWRKGGVVFGPTKDRNFKRKINKKMNLKALSIALSEKVRKNNFFVVDELSPKNKKTKEFVSFLANVKTPKRVLFCFAKDENGLSLYSRNISGVNNIVTGNLNVHDILNNTGIVMSKASVEYLENKYKKA